jgi:hypothetical protein
MQANNEFDEVEATLVGELKSLRPVGGTPDVIAAAFVAGRRSGRGRERFWQMASLAILVGSLAIHGFPGRAPKFRAEPIAASRVESSPMVRSVPNILELEESVLDYRPAGLPSAHSQFLPAVSGNDSL